MKEKFTEKPGRNVEQLIVMQVQLKFFLFLFG
jgi:hypothetical protein